MGRGLRVARDYTYRKESGLQATTAESEGGRDVSSVINNDNTGRYDVKLASFIKNSTVPDFVWFK